MASYLLKGIKALDFRKLWRLYIVIFHFLQNSRFNSRGFENYSTCAFDSSRQGNNKIKIRFSSRSGRFIPFQSIARTLRIGLESKVSPTMKFHLQNVQLLRFKSLKATSSVVNSEVCISNYTAEIALAAIKRKLIDFLTQNHLQVFIFVAILSVILSHQVHSVNSSSGACQ